MAIDPSVPSAAHKSMARQWRKAEALCSGTDGMQLLGEEFLPRWARETPAQYAARKKRTFLFEYFKTASDRAASKPFAKPVIWKPEDPALKEMVEEDVDMMGNNLSVFAYRAFLSVLRKGMVGILVDWSGTATEQTLADRRAAGSRAYWCKVEPESVLECRCARDAQGMEQVVLLRILGYEDRPSPTNPYETHRFMTVTIWTPERIEYWALPPANAPVQMRTVVNSGSTETRVGPPEQDRVIPSTAMSGGNKPEWVHEKTEPNLLKRVPFHMFYANKKGPMESDLPMSGVIDKNIEHWQSSSNQRVALDVARFPMLGASGISEEEAKKVLLGPLTFLSTNNPQGKFYYVENQGSALAAGERDLAEIKAQMSAMVADLYTASSPASRATATEAGAKDAEAKSPIQTLGNNFSDFLETVMGTTAEIADLDPETTVGEIEINDDFTMDGAANKELELLGTLRTSGDLSHDEIIRELQRRRVLDPEEEFKGDSARMDALLASKTAPPSAATKPPAAGPQGNMPPMPGGGSS